MMRSALCLLLATASLHAGAQLSQSYDGCIARARKNTVQVNLCVQKETALQDARLNKSYKARMLALHTESDKATLKHDELQWLKKRDAMCKVSGDTVDNICVVRETAARANELEQAGTK